MSKQKKKAASKSRAKLSVVKAQPKPKKDAARNAMFAEMVREFTVSLQGAAGKFGIKPEDLSVTVHIQLKEHPAKKG